MRFYCLFAVGASTLFRIFSQRVRFAKGYDTRKRLRELSLRRGEDHPEEVRRAEAGARQHKHGLFLEQLLRELPVVLDVLTWREKNGRVTGSKVEQHKQMRPFP